MILALIGFVGLPLLVGGASGSLTAAAVRKARFIPAGFDMVAASAPQALSVTDGSLRLTLQTGPTYKPDAPLQGVLVLQDAGGQQTALTIAAPFVPDDSLPLWQILLMALAGGLVLNLMPCVFPVLALKAVGLAKHAHGARRAALSGAAFYAAGVLITFCGLGLGLIALRQAGAVVGWGSQFQSPVFVAGMALASLYLDHRPALRRWSPWAALPLMAFGYLARARDIGWLAEPALGLGYAALLGFAVTWLTQTRAQSPFAVAGRASYSLFLIHVPILSLFTPIVLHAPSGAGPYAQLALLLALSLPVCMGAAMGMYTWIELPLWTRLSRGPARPAPAAP